MTIIARFTKQYSWVIMRLGQVAPNQTHLLSSPWSVQIVREAQPLITVYSVES